MKNVIKSIIILPLIIVNFQCGSHETEKYLHFEDGVKIIKITDSINKEVTISLFYDSVTNVYLGYNKEINDSLFEALILDKYGDTSIVYKNEIENRYNKKKQIRSWYKLLPISRTFVGISFDTIGKLNHNYGSLDFLMEKDTMYLTKYYPDWKEQIKTWKAK